MDHHRGCDPPPRGRRHHFHPLLEVVSDRQAGIPARRHDLHPTETKGKVPSLLYRCFPASVFQNDFCAVNFVFVIM